MEFTDEQPFLDAIFARYHDDGPRLIYADFLEDSGDPARAELVRVQLALARMNEEHPRRPELAEREAELLNTHRERWTAHLGGLVAGVEFRRGVPDSVSVDSTAFHSLGERLFATIRVRRLRLLDDANLLPRLIHSPLLAHVRELDLCDSDLGYGGVELLTRSLHLKKLLSLDLGFNGLDDASVITIARTTAFSSLTSLALNDNGQITSEGLKALATSPFLTGLIALDLSGNDIAEAGVLAAIESQCLPKLQLLQLSRNPIGDGGLTALTRSALLDRMLTRSSRLELRGHPGGPIGPIGAASLAASPALTKCVTLDLTGNELGDRGLTSLLLSPNLTSLRVLKLGRNQITDAGVVALRDALPGLIGRLRALDLSENRLTRYGLNILEMARGDSPVILDVSGNVQVSSGTAPVPVGEVVPGVLRTVADAADAAELRRRITHPASRTSDRNSPPG